MVRGKVRDEHGSIPPINLDKIYVWERADSFGYPTSLLITFIIHPAKLNNTSCIHPCIQSRSYICPFISISFNTSSSSSALFIYTRYLTSTEGSSYHHSIDTGFKEREYQSRLPLQ